MAQDEQRERLQRLRASRQPGVRVELNSNQFPGAVGPGVQGGIARAPSSGHGRAVAALVFLLLVAGGLLGGVAYVFHSFHTAVGGPKRHVSFDVRPGEGVSGIAADLERQGLVSNSLIFQLFYRLNGSSQGIQAGHHTLTTDMSMDDIAKQLQTVPAAVAPPPPSFICCTFLAGKRAEEIARLLEKYGVASYADTMHEIQHGTFDYWFLKGRPAGAGVEGFLFPGHYAVTKHYSAHKLINRMLAAFGRNFTPAMHAAAAKAHRSVFQIVTVASIVQRESSLPRVQRAVASVYYNRLTDVTEVNMRLEADPTVQYALGYRQGEQTWWERHLNQAMIDEVQSSPYNTYSHQGLPPGPISNPGPDALKAALRPASTPYLYFEVLSKDGKTAHTYFCRTLQCQQAGAGVSVQ